MANNIKFSDMPDGFKEHSVTKEKISWDSLIKIFPRGPKEISNYEIYDQEFIPQLIANQLGVRCLLCNRAIFSSSRGPSELDRGSMGQIWIYKCGFFMCMGSSKNRTMNDGREITIYEWKRIFSPGDSGASLVR